MRQPYLGRAVNFAVNAFGDARNGVSKFLVVLGYGATFDDVSEAVTLANEVRFFLV